MLIFRNRASFDSLQKTRRSFCVQEKVDLLKRFDCSGESIREFCRKEGISPSLLSDWRKNRDDLLKSPSALKKRRLSPFAEVDKALLEYICKAQEVHLPLSDDLLATRATEIAQEQGYELSEETGFGAISLSWVTRFKRRHGYRAVRLKGEIGSNSKALAEAELPNLRETISRYSACNIYNFDETALFWKCMPDTTIAKKGSDSQPGPFTELLFFFLTCILTLVY